MQADSILTHGIIYTMNEKKSIVEAAAVANGRIIALGTTEEIRLQFGRAGVEEIDLAGSTMIPGLVDAHMHLTWYGQKIAGLDLSGMRSYGEMKEAISKRADETPSGDWIVGMGWDENFFEDAYIPDRADLDGITSVHPVYLTRTCGHASVANTLALTVAGLTLEMSDPDGGKLGRDGAGHLNGRLYENAQELVSRQVPAPTYDKIKDQLRNAMRLALKAGLTGVHTEDLREIGSVADMMKMYRELAVEEDLRLRSHHLLYYPFMDEIEQLGLTTGDGDEWVNLGAMKIFADGAFGSRTALLSRPYSDDPSTSGVAIHTQGELNALVARARKQGMSVAVHTIGDEAVRMTLRAIAAYRPVTKHYDRIIHAQTLDAALVEAFANTHAIIDIQPRFVASDFPWVQERLGAERMDYAYAWKTLIERGLHCPAGSDAPIEPLEPLLGIHAAVTRTKPGEPETVFLPNQRLTVAQAVGLFTYEPAFAIGREKDFGTIEVGKTADFTVFAEDIFKMNPDELYRATVSRTIIGGKVVYDRA